MSLEFYDFVNSKACVNDIVDKLL